MRAGSAPLWLCDLGQVTPPLWACFFPEHPRLRHGRPRQTLVSVLGRLVLWWTDRAGSSRQCGWTPCWLSIQEAAILGRHGSSQTRTCPPPSPPPRPSKEAGTGPGAAAQLCCLSRVLALGTRSGLASPQPRLALPVLCPGGGGPVARTTPHRARMRRARGRSEDGPAGTSAGLTLPSRESAGGKPGWRSGPTGPHTH